MNVVVAIDSLKGSLTSLEAGQAIKQGIHRVMPKARVCVRPLADGGEGTVEALTLGMNGRKEYVWVTGPLGEPVKCEYGIWDETKTAIVEMSGAAGITLIEEQNRNPLHATTYGVGEVIRDAISKGCRHFIIGIGGSATNDGGLGMLQALGFGMLDGEDKPVSLGAKGLKELRKITKTDVIPELKTCSFRIACDVINPLCGVQGCSAVFGPQKGATSEMIAEMDKWLAGFAALAAEKFPQANPDYPGTGAAGGMGFAFLTFMDAKLESGSKIILEETHLEDYIKNADIVITGEGRLDAQTVLGKAPISVARVAKKYGKLVLAFSGCATADAAVCNTQGIDAFFPILRGAMSVEDAMDRKNARENMIATVEQVFRLVAKAKCSKT